MMERPKSMLKCVSHVRCHQDNNKLFKKSGYTKLQRQTTLIKYRPMRQTFFGVQGMPIYDFKTRQNNGRYEGQLGGMLCPPNNF